MSKQKTLLYTESCNRTSDCNIDNKNRKKKCVKLRSPNMDRFVREKNKPINFYNLCVSKNNKGCCLENPSRFLFKEIKPKSKSGRVVTQFVTPNYNNTGEEAFFEGKYFLNNTKRASTVKERQEKYTNCGWNNLTYKKCPEKYPVCAKKRRQFSKKKQSENYNRYCISNGRKNRTSGCCISKKYNRLTWKKISGKKK